VRLAAHQRFLGVAESGYEIYKPLLESTPLEKLKAAQRTARFLCKDWFPKAAGS